MAIARILFAPHSQFKPRLLDTPQVCQLKWTPEEVRVLNKDTMQIGTRYVHGTSKILFNRTGHRLYYA
jgi:hypothetical protein